MFLNIFSGYFFLNIIKARHFRQKQGFFHACVNFEFFFFRLVERKAPKYTFNSFPAIDGIIRLSVL